MPTAGGVDPPSSVCRGAEPEPADTILLRHRRLKSGIRLQWHRGFGARWTSEPPFVDSGRDPTSERVVVLDSLYIPQSGSRGHDNYGRSSYPESTDGQGWTA